MPKKSPYDLPSDDRSSMVRGLDGNGYTKTLLCFLPKCDLGRTINRCMVRIATAQMLLLKRPYQVYSVPQIVECIDDDNGDGFVWHTTGSSKTLTSFKASTLLNENDHIHQGVFVVGRKDLDRQTREEFNKFQGGCVEENTNTAALVRRRLSEDYADKVIVITIQKLGLVLDESSKRNKQRKKNDQATYKDLVLPLRAKENRKRGSLVYNASLINHCP